MVGIPRLIVRDGLVPEGVIDASLASAPPPKSRQWRPGPVRLPEAHPGMAFIAAAIFGTFSKWHTEPRPDFDYAGLYQLMDGEMIVPHREPTSCTMRGFQRRVGITMFLNDPDGGDFELWDEHGPVDIIQPVRGRFLLWDVNSYHAISTAGSRRLTLEMYLISRRVTNDKAPLRDDFEYVPTTTSV